MRNLIQRVVYGVVAVVLLLPFLQLDTAFGDTLNINQYPVTNGEFIPTALAAGPDGNLWYGVGAGFDGRIFEPVAICNMSPVGVNGSCYNVPFPGKFANQEPISKIITGPDGNLWFAAYNTGAIWQMSPTGTLINQYQLDGGGSVPTDLTVGPDGNVWFTYQNFNVNTGVQTGGLGYVTSTGQITEYPGPLTNNNLVSGPDGNIWFTYNNQVGYITPSGTYNYFSLPLSSNPDIAGANGPLTVGPDGNIWLTAGEENADSTDTGLIFKISTTGNITEYQDPTPDSSLGSITTGPDGNIWFVEQVNTTDALGNLNFLDTQIGRITPSGQFTDYSAPDDIAPYQNTYLISGPADSVWATGVGEINQIVLGEVTTPATPTNLTAPTPTNQQPSLSWDAVSGAASYKIYRDGTNIGSSTTNSFTDTSAPEGTNAYYVTALNSAGESSPSNTISVVYDTTAPTLSMPIWSANPLAQGQSTTMSVTASDAGSGLEGVTYSVDGGTPQAMTYNSGTGTWQATFGQNLTADTYNIAVTATDNADNTATVGDVLAVYNQSNGYVTGHADLQPTASDAMPIALDTSNHPAKLVLGFTNVMSPASGSFSADYKVKNNYNEFSLASTGIDWLVVQDSSHASIEGQANLVTYSNGAKTETDNVTVRMDITLGTNGSPDTVTIKIFSPGVNPNTGTPAYVINDADAGGSNLMIHP